MCEQCQKVVADIAKALRANTHCCTISQNKCPKAQYCNAQRNNCPKAHSCCSSRNNCPNCCSALRNSCPRAHTCSSSRNNCPNCCNSSQIRCNNTRKVICENFCSENIVPRPLYYTETTIPNTLEIKSSDDNRDGYKESPDRNKLKKTGNGNKNERKVVKNFVEDDGDDEVEKRVVKKTVNKKDGNKVVKKNNNFKENKVEKVDKVKKSFNNNNNNNKEDKERVVTRTPSSKPSTKKVIKKQKDDNSSHTFKYVPPNSSKIDKIEKIHKTYKIDKTDRTDKTDTEEPKPKRNINQLWTPKPRVCVGERPNPYAVSKRALVYVASDRMEFLAKPKVDRSIDWCKKETNSRILSSKSSKQSLTMDSADRSYTNPKPNPFGVKQEALLYCPSKRIEQLAVPKVRSETIRTNKISPSALRAVASDRIKKLAQPKIRTSPEPVKDPFSVSASALNYQPSERILNLSVPNLRHVTSCSKSILKRECPQEMMLGDECFA